MNEILRPVIGVARFFYHFVVGDDSVVAAVMLVALGATALLVVNGINAWGLVPVVAVLMTWVSLRRHRAL